MSERLWYLKQCPLLQRLPAEQLHGLERRCRFRKYPRGTPIYLFLVTCLVNVEFKNKKTLPRLA
ncbi:MAG: hypothetical protein AAF961_03760, partial [Planctomycetota bacterium]